MSEHHHSQLGMHPPGTENLTHAAILRRAKVITTMLVLLLLIGAGVTIFMKVLHAQHLAGTMEQQSHVYVTTMRAQSGNGNENLTLPSTLQGIIEAPIFARSSGYVLRWHKDIGAVAHKNDLLAEIDAPEMDAQLAQAVASKAQAVSSLDLAQTSAQRWEELRKKDAVTQQELNERRSAYTQAQANLAAAQANLQRLQDLQDYKKVRAPFSGVIIHRNIEVGDLIDGGGAGKALFTMAKVSQLRLYVYVPQAYAQRIHVGDAVSVTQHELPGQTFAGKVVRIAGAIDVASRTLQMEINLPNQDGHLLAGSYVEAGFHVPGNDKQLYVTANVLLFRPEGTQIAVVDATGRVRLHHVTVGHDLGKTVEILSGISAGDQLVLNPPDSLADNDLVRVQTAGKNPL